MRRILRKIVITAVALAVIGGAGTATAAATPGAAPHACTGAGAIQITHFAFDQSTVTPGQMATGHLIAVNCTAQNITTNVVSYGRFTDNSSAGIPPGCPAIDPIGGSETIAPDAQYTMNFATLTFASCTATALQQFVTFYASDGSVLASATTQVTIDQSSTLVVCHVAYNEQSEWRGGFTASIAITNIGSSPITPWSLAFTFGGDQRITNVWGAAATQNGNAVKLSGLSYDSAVPAGSTLSVGFNGTWNASDAPPTSFALNGVTCVAPAQG